MDRKQKGIRNKWAYKMERFFPNDSLPLARLCLIKAPQPLIIPTSCGGVVQRHMLMGGILYWNHDTSLLQIFLLSASLEVSMCVMKSSPSGIQEHSNQDSGQLLSTAWSTWHLSWHLIIEKPLKLLKETTLCIESEPRIQCALWSGRNQCRM